MNINPTISLNRYLLSLARPYKTWFFLIGLVGVLWAFTNTFIPYILKLIIDHVVSFKGNKVDIFASTTPYVFTYIFLWITLCVNMRFFRLDKIKIIS